ncbi:hypothetical protein NEDG_00123 [Nematocida displodere]|uniref:Phosphatidylinositol transfer protein N-terminal domain-containing protein n=1 Tax=Nematocida displodere TaxID=1805483 RepID=A0A177EID1_9MICR|nr:hypothetical protein NEDG_00123 [Nematocida displodere]
MPQRTALFTIYMPYHLPEYNIGHLMTTCKVSLREAEKGMRVLVQKNEISAHEDLGECQHTVKTLDFSKKVPGFFRAVAPSGSLTMTETSYNAFPRCSTHYTSGALSEKKFYARIDTMFFEGYREVENPFDTLPEVDRFEVLELATCPQLAENFDVSTMKNDDGSLKFAPGWEKTASKVITVFKRVQIDFHLMFIGGKYIEDIEKFMRKIFIQGHQEVLKYHNEWIGLSMEDVRKEEERTKTILAAKYS